MCVSTCKIYVLVSVVCASSTQIRKLFVLLLYLCVCMYVCMYVYMQMFVLFFNCNSLEQRLISVFLAVMILYCTIAFLTGKCSGVMVCVVLYIVGTGTSSFSVCIGWS